MALMSTQYVLRWDISCFVWPDNYIHYKTEFLAHW